MRFNSPLKSFSRRLGRLFTSTFLWPDVDDAVAIRTVCHTGMWVSFVVAGFTGVAYTIAGYPLAALIIAGIFVLIGVGIRKHSRIAAVLSVLLYIGPQVATGSISVVSFIFAFLFIGSVRATFALHRLNKG